MLGSQSSRLPCLPLWCSHRLTVDSWQSRLTKCRELSSSLGGAVQQVSHRQRSDSIQTQWWAATSSHSATSLEILTTGGGRPLSWSEDIIVSTQIHSASLSTWLNLGFTAASVSLLAAGCCCHWTWAVTPAERDPLLAPYKAENCLVCCSHLAPHHQHLHPRPGDKTGGGWRWYRCGSGRRTDTDNYLDNSPGTLPRYRWLQIIISGVDFANVWG